jgi:hypothetical protein
MMKVYLAINAVQAALAKQGISKDRKNIQQGYQFRGIDDVYNAISSLMAEHHLCVLPRMISRNVTERITTKTWVERGEEKTKETTLFYVVVDAEFDFVSSEDGTKHTVKTYGEAMDSGDKATNKAMSAAYKYAMMQTFAIPTEGDNDADSTTHSDIQPKSQITPRAGAWESLKPHQQKRVLTMADMVRNEISAKGYLAAGELLESEFAGEDPEMTIALWGKLDSKERNSIKQAIGDRNKELTTAGAKNE